MIPLEDNWPILLSGTGLSSSMVIKLTSISVAKNNVRILVIPAEAGIHPANRGTGPRIESGVTPRDAGRFQ
jgi:hypothetical protein